MINGESIICYNKANLKMEKSPALFFNAEAGYAKITSEKASPKGTGFHENTFDLFDHEAVICQAVRKEATF
jgi:hypothetical protein